MKAQKKSVILVLDEIDALHTKIGDDFLYNLTRMNTELKDASLTIVGITNDLSFKEKLDSRVRSSLGEQEILFKPYDAMQLRELLQQRIEKGFVANAVSEEALSKCAALAAQEHGDARKALDLLVVAGEVAERMGESHIQVTHIDVAEEKIDMDRVLETVRMQPRQPQVVLYAILRLAKAKQENDRWVDNRLLTGDVFREYAQLCATCGMKVLTQRRISDLITEMDMLGIVSTRVISKGRYGRTREIVCSLDDKTRISVEHLISSRLS